MWGEIMCAKSELKEILNQLVDTYKIVYGQEIVKIVLYGSYARGDYSQDSDIDVVAIVKGERNELQDKLKKIWDVSSDLEIEYGTIVSPTVIPYKEYEQYKTQLPYYMNIENEGVNLVA